MPIDLGAIFANLMGAQNAKKHPMDSYLDPTFDPNGDEGKMGYMDENGNTTQDNASSRKPYTTPGMWAHLVNPRTSYAVDQANFNYGNAPIADAQAEELAKGVATNRAKDAGLPDLAGSMAMFRSGRGLVNGGTLDPNALMTEGLDAQSGRPALNSAANMFGAKTDASTAENMYNNVDNINQSNADAIKAKGFANEEASIVNEGRAQDADKVVQTGHNVAATNMRASGAQLDERTIPNGDGTARVIDEEGNTVMTVIDPKLSDMDIKMKDVMNPTWRFGITGEAVVNHATGQTTYVKKQETPSPAPSRAALSNIGWSAAPSQGLIKRATNGTINSIVDAIENLGSEADIRGRNTVSGLNNYLFGGVNIPESTSSQPATPMDLAMRKKKLGFKLTEEDQQLLNTR
jgi:hypothetical protein